MNKYLILSLFIISCSRGFGQLIVKDTLRPSFEWSYHLLDIPYIIDAAKTESIRSNNDIASSAATIKLKDFENFYRNLSMTQMMDMSHNLHGTL